jgi:hemoglobin-like flavoprotein
VRAEEICSGVAGRGVTLTRRNPKHSQGREIMQLSESVDSLLHNSSLFGAVFYQRFFAAVPAAGVYFNGIDMRRQALLLTMALTVIRQHHEHHYPSTREFLHYLGSKHHDRKIPVDLYNDWRRVLLGTLSAFHGPAWTPELAGDWTAAIDEAIDAMMAGYTDHISV